MSILNALWEWRFAIVIVAAFVLYCLFEWEKAKGTLYNLMLQAKRMAKDAVLKSGLEQEEWVLRKAYQFLPLWARTLLSENMMRKLIQWLFHKGKDYLDNGKLDNSI